MVTEDLNTVVDNIADKLGTAVKSVTPIAEQVLREFQMFHTVGAIIWGVVFVISFIILGIIINGLNKYKENSIKAGNYDEACYYIPLVFSSACTGSLWIACLAEGIQHTLKAIAPTYHLLKDIL